LVLLYPCIFWRALFSSSVATAYLPPVLHLRLATRVRSQNHLFASLCLSTQCFSSVFGHIRCAVHI
jgi:hypothetical protein